MLQVYLDQVHPPPFLDASAKALFQKGRDNFFRFGLDRIDLHSVKRARIASVRVGR